MYAIPVETSAMKRTLNTTINRSKNEKMKSIPCILSCLLLGVTSCQYASPVTEKGHDPFLISGDDLTVGKWVDENLVTNDLRCRGIVQEGEVLCDIVNVSDHDLILNRGISGFGYLIKYRTKSDKVTFQERLTPIEWHFEHIEILGPLKLPEMSIASWASTSFVIKLPADCVKLCGVTIRVPYTTYAEMGKCKNACDLRRLFDRNARHVLVEFPQGEGR